MAAYVNAVSTQQLKCVDESYRWCLNLLRRIKPTATVVPPLHLFKGATRHPVDYEIPGIVPRLRELTATGRLVLFINLYLSIYFVVAALQHIILSPILIGLLVAGPNIGTYCARIWNAGADEISQSNKPQSSGCLVDEPMASAQCREDGTAVAKAQPREFTFKGKVYNVPSIVSTIIFSEDDSDGESCQEEDSVSYTTIEEDAIRAKEQASTLRSSKDDGYTDEDEDEDDDENWHDDDEDSEVCSNTPSIHGLDGGYRLVKANLLLLRKRQHRRLHHREHCFRNPADDFADINAMIQILTEGNGYLHSIDEFLYKNRSNWMRTDSDGRNCLMQGLLNIFWDRHGMSTHFMEDFSVAHKNSVRQLSLRYMPPLRECQEWQLNQYSSQYRHWWVARNIATDSLHIDDATLYPIERVKGFRKLANGELGDEEVTVRADLSLQAGFCDHPRQMIQWTCPGADDSYRDLMKAYEEPVAPCFWGDHAIDHRIRGYQAHFSEEQ